MTLEEIDEKINKMRHIITLAEEGIISVVYHAAEEPDESSRLALLRHLYWERFDIGANVIADAFGFPNDFSLRAAVGGKGGVCSSCGECFPLGSRTAWNEYKKESLLGKKLCKSCEGAKQERTQKERDEFRAKEQRDEESRVKALRALPYQEYLDTDWWKNIRGQVLRRARYKCQLCNQNEHLNVHHRTYERLGNEDIKDLIVLCEKCHKTFHGKEMQ